MQYTYTCICLQKVYACILVYFPTYWKSFIWIQLQSWKHNLSFPSLSLIIERAEFIFSLPCSDFLLISLSWRGIVTVQLYFWPLTVSSKHCGGGSCVQVVQLQTETACCRHKNTVDQHHVLVYEYGFGVMPWNATVCGRIFECADCLGFMSWHIASVPSQLCRTCFADRFSSLKPMCTML